jgi:hypothetical protein
MTADGPLEKTRSDFERGEAEGLRLARAGRSLPHLRGGAYAVGLLFGYRAALRSAPHGHSGAHQPA